MHCDRKFIVKVELVIQGKIEQQQSIPASRDSVFSEDCEGRLGLCVRVCLCVFEQKLLFLFPSLA